MKVHNKLVRDKIPEIIEDSRRRAVTRILPDEEYIAALETKLNEEVAEYQVDKNLEEMADVLEVIQAICVARGYTLEQLEEKQKEKAEERGSFSDKVYLEYVE
jgi:predicted house-cleaning noncanonical NTP pyrophosphatase (MazG superfamily)